MDISHVNYIAEYFSQLTKKIKETIMDKLQFRGSWKEAKGRLKEEYGELTDDDLQYSEGQEDQLVGRLQQKLGKSKDEVRKIISNI